MSQFASSPDTCLRGGNSKNQNLWFQLILTGVREHMCALVPLFCLQPAFCKPKIKTQGGPSRSPCMPGPHCLGGVAIHVLICFQRAMGFFCLVSCWLLAQHPPWHPACPSGQQPHSIHLGGLKVDRGGRIQGFLKEERRRLWD